MEDELRYLVVDADTGAQRWYRGSDYPAAETDAKATLSTLYEVQMMADYGEKEV